MTALRSAIRSSIRGSAYSPLVGKWGTVAPAEPVTVSDQNARFLDATVAGDGGWQPVDSNGNRVGLASVDDQTGATRTWSIASECLVANGTPAVDDAQALVLTTTTGQQFTATVTIPGDVSGYSCRNGYDIDAAVTAHAAGSDAARTIELRPGVSITDGFNGTGAAGQMDGATFLSRGFSAKPLTVTSEDTGNKATIYNYRARVQGSDSIYFRYLNFAQSDDHDWTDWEANAQVFIHDGGSATTNNIRAQYCDFQGRSGTALNATILADKAVSTAWNLYDWFAGYGPTATDVSAALNLPSPIFLGAATASVIENCTGSRLYSGPVWQMKGTVSVQDNDFSDLYYDGYLYTADTTTDAGIKTVTDNTVGRIFGARAAEGAGPHGDAMQFNAVSGYLSNATIDGLVAYMGSYGVDSNGDDFQGPFASNGNTVDTVVFRRCVLAIQTLHGISFNHAINVVVDQCTIMEQDPGNPIGQSLKPQIRLGAGTGGTSSGVIHIRDCIIASSSNSIVGDAEVTSEGNVFSANGDVSTYYDGPFDPDSRAATIAAFTPKVGSAIANIGAVTTAGALRTGNRPPAASPSPSLAVDGTTITVTVDDTIWDGGSAVTSQDIRYSTDGSNWTTVTGVTSPHDLTGLSGSTEYFIQTRDVNAVGNGPWSASASDTTVGADVTAPILSSASGTATGTTTADLSVTTDEGNGTLYTVVTGSATEPTATQIKAGQDHTGSAATFADDQVITTTGAKSFSATGLTAAATYYAHFMHEDAATNQSTVARSSSFTTDASFTAQSTSFNGTTSQLRSTSLSLSGAQEGTFAIWLYYDGSWTNNHAPYSCKVGTTLVMSVAAQTSGRLQVFLSPGTTWTSATSVFAGDGWYHVLVSYKSGDGGFFKISVNGATPADGPDITATTLDIGGTITRCSVGSLDGSLFWGGDLAYVYHDVDTALDITVQANREKFILAGVPVDLGGDGSTPTGAQPAFYFDGGATMTNLGSGGSLTPTDLTAGTTPAV